MELKNIIEDNGGISVTMENSCLHICFAEIKSEFAVIVRYIEGKELIADIIDKIKSTIKINDDNIKEIELVDIYNDMTVFRYEFYNTRSVEDKETFAEVHEESVPPIVYNLQPEPPLLYTMPPDNSNEVGSRDIFCGLRMFDNFDCKLPEHCMYEFDEDTMRTNGIKIMFNGQSVPTWFPYLNYHDSFSEEAPFPKRIIGKMIVSGDEYITYGVLCRMKDIRQPFFGATGFVYLVSADNDWGYWFMYLDKNTGKICYPYDEEYMSCDEDL